ncbi:MAG TPA: SHOCT domain-containing protein [Actinophytocola sp.]|jgi:putative membrane protein|uniref:SHOCT domain-containing protein n=1 Tax=Actinophytocola sp. TaxID=1872138 RepID=UPI002DFE27D3|nr:SHOCT domain-containing protein [Actinophytocola sp.]
MMFWYGNGMSGWGYALMTISTVVFWALVIAGAIALVRYFGRTQPLSSPPPHRLTPEQVLAERFARGEIDEDEYHRRLHTLHADAHPVRKA